MTACLRFVCVHFLNAFASREIDRERDRFLANASCDRASVSCVRTKTVFDSRRYRSFRASIMNVHSNEFRTGICVNVPDAHSRRSVGPINQHITHHIWFSDLAICVECVACEMSCLFVPPQQIPDFRLCASEIERISIIQEWHYSGNCLRIKPTTTSSHILSTLFRFLAEQ